MPVSQEEQKQKQETKKNYIISLYKQGHTDMLVVAQMAKTKPSYVASVLQAAGLISGYTDLYTTPVTDQNIYSRFFKNILSFKDVASARESVDRIDNLFRYFGRLGDRAGQHHAQVLALTGRNRARWCGKYEEARIFAEWLMKN
ncbi:MAG: hypothetical protein HY819_01355 [Acidobacteria bacterium]|nr:hypothetical protein [Acidobacteriota bacterium]